MSGRGMEILAAPGLPRGRGRRRPRGADPRRRSTTCADGDVVVVTSKIVSKAEGAVVAVRPAASDRCRETVRVRRPARRDTDRADPARPGDGRGRRRRVQHRARHGRCCCPTTPTRPRVGSASRPAGARRRATSRVVVTDTAGRAWRNGQTDIADRRGRAGAAAQTRGRPRRATATRSRSPPRRSPTRSPVPPSWSRPSWPAGRSRSCAGSMTGFWTAERTVRAPRR